MPIEPLRTLPSIERLLSRPAMAQLSSELTRDRVRDLLREVTEEVRREIAAGTPTPGFSHSAEALAEEIERRTSRKAQKLKQPSLRPVINATGVVLHTNLGRAPLADEALNAIDKVGRGYSNLEFDIERGERGRRDSHCQELLARLTGAEAAVVVNNNAAAVLLVLNTLAQGGEVIVSRGEMIEIGGSFRIPEVMEKSGASLREVGTTNRTRLSDYERAINERTRLILRVHPSNYRIIGFTERPSAREMAALAQSSGIPCFEDLGSGCLIDLTPFGISDEPVVADSLRAGVSVVSFSGDKMLGGPQAGVIAGSRAIVEQVRKNPLMRALRVGKLTYSAIEATLRLYERGVAESEIPIIRAISLTRERIFDRAVKLMESIVLRCDDSLSVSLVEGESVIGGGAAPGITLPTVLVALKPNRVSAASLEARLRSNKIPIITRTDSDRVLIDPRTVLPGEESIISDALADAADIPKITAAADP